MKLKSHPREYVLVLLCAAASLYGVVLVYSAGASPLTQAICLLTGVLAAITISTIDYHRLARRWYVFAIGAVILVLLTFTPLGYTVPGTDDRNWLYLSLAGKTLLFQPSELLKIVFILTFSAHLSRVRSRLRRPLTLLGVLLHGLLPAALVAAQGDDGNAAVFLIVFLALLVAGGVPKRYLLLLAALTAIAVPFAWNAMSDDKKGRFLCLFYVDAYRDTIGWQQDIAVTAIGSGRLTGVGLGEGGAHRLYARHNDFIFTVAGEELGFIGAATVLAILFCILLRLYQLSRHSTDHLGQLLCLGFMALLGGQACINIGMALRLLPVLGITLPFFSAGGSSLLTLFIGVGLCCSTRRYRLTV